MASNILLNELTLYGRVLKIVHVMLLTFHYLDYQVINVYYIKTIFLAAHAAFKTASSRTIQKQERLIKQRCVRSCLVALLFVIETFFIYKNTACKNIQAHMLRVVWFSRI